MKTVRYYLEIEGNCTFNKLELSKKDYEEIEAKLEKKFIETDSSIEEFYVDRLKLDTFETEQQISNGFCYIDGSTIYRLYYRKCKEGYCFKNKDKGSKP